MAEPYLRDGAAIYERSFAIIRAEADLTRFSTEEADVAVRMIHACGLVEAARHVQFGHGLVADAGGRNVMIRSLARRTMVDDAAALRRADEGQRGRTRMGAALRAAGNVDDDVLRRR